MKNASTSSSKLTLWGGLALLVPAAIGLGLSGVPTLLRPYPALTIIPAFLLSNLGLERISIAIVPAIPTLLFFAWNPGLFRGQGRVPIRTYALLATVIALSLYWFISGWRYGLQYQGPFLTRIFCVVNGVWAVSLVVAFIIIRKREPSFKANLFLHWMLFAWLAWYAFPYLGEMP